MSETPGYYSNVNEDLLRAIPPNSKRVLEVGCGTGALASRFKLINPKCVYWGVEADYESTGIAMNNPALDKVMGVDVEDAIYSGSLLTLKDRFDCIVFGDVLEHLVDPGIVVKTLTSHALIDGGSIVACTPNVSHWSVISTLLNGDWPQHESGLFDRTHLRWMTRKTIVEMFEAAGLVVSKITPRNIAPGGERLIDAVKTFGLAEDPKRFAAESQAYQWLIHAIKGELPSRRILVRGFPAEACCARPRLSEPGAFFNTIPGVRYSETPAEVQPGEAVVAVRQRFNIDARAVRTHLKHGHLIVGEWDDDPWHEGLKPKMKVPVEWALKACHVVTVSTEAIAELVRPINPDVYVVPNQVAAVGPEREYVEGDVVRVYMGGQRSREDWAEAVAIVNAAVAENPDRYDFVVVHDRGLYDALETKHKTFYAFQPYDKYRALLRSCDVAISPLADTRLNRCKSDITAIECAAEGVLCLDDGNPFRTPPFDSDRDLFIREGKAARDGLIKGRMLCGHYMHRYELINRWLDDKAELDRRLFDRLPELKEELG